MEVHLHITNYPNVFQFQLCFQKIRPLQKIPATRIDHSQSLTRFRAQSALIKISLQPYLLQDPFR